MWYFLRLHREATEEALKLDSLSLSFQLCAICEKRPSIDTSCAIITAGRKAISYPADIWQDGNNVFFTPKETENLKSESFED